MKDNTVEMLSKDEIKQLEEIIPEIKKAIIEKQKTGQSIDNIYQSMGVTLTQEITELDLSNYGITNLPKCIGKMQALEKLDLSTNNFLILPDTIGELKNLKILKLVNCKELNTLPESIKNCTSLKVINIRYCDIDKLSDSITILSNSNEKIKIISNKSDINKIKDITFNIMELCMDILCTIIVSIVEFFISLKKKI